MIDLKDAVWSIARDRLRAAREVAALAAAGLAGVIGGARIEQSEVYQPASPDTKQLTVVIGLDRTAAGQTPTPTP